MKEIRILGPPGTGKSTRLATKEIPDAANRYGNDKILVTSFTRTAAKEISSKPSIKTGKPIDIPTSQIGTLHKFCYNLFGMPKLAHEVLDQWNDQYPQYEINASLNTASMDVVVDSNGAGNGDILLNKLDIMRAKMIPENRWGSDSAMLKTFHKLWTDFKNNMDVMDFTDLIDKAAVHFPYAPGRPEVIFVDEAQDFTKLQLHLVRNWSSSASWLVMVGDDDQTIFSFTGATPDAFIQDSDTLVEKRILDQSFRVPEQVYNHAMKIVRKIKHRESKKYKPRQFKGLVKIVNDNYRNITKTGVLKSIKQDLSQGKSVMFLTTCAYMLNPLIRDLRMRGIPFSNKYRAKTGQWNPLSRGGKKRVSAVDLIEAFHSCGDDGPYWTVEQFLKWAPYLKTGEYGFRHGKGKPGITALKKAVEEKVDGLHTTRNVIEQLMGEDAVFRALERDTKWLYENMVKNRLKAMEYPLNVLKTGGVSAVTERPNLTVGTVHSVKGGEADSVYICPDISYRGVKMLDKLFGNEKIQYVDSLFRLFYVGITRARESLTILRPATRYYVQIER
ncbi:MAG: ATP-dependent helicase [Clostridia bacterium]|nr:ATP-dependent helicase [Clostridia bacterium]